MPRRRFQRGRLFQRGQNPKWVAMFWDDVFTPTFHWVRRTVTLGECKRCHVGQGSPHCSRTWMQ